MRLRRRQASAMSRHMAGSALHFVTKPGVWPVFTEWMRGVDMDTSSITDEAIRRYVSRAHDELAPDCNVPIEVM